MSKDFELTVTKVVPAPRKTAFQAWLDPKALAEFMTPGEGMTVPRAETEPRVGGEFLIVMKAGEQELPHEGEYREIREYDRLAFTWLSSQTIPDSLVTLDFEELGPKETRVTLHHVGFPNEESRNNHEGGWTAILPALAQAV